MTENPSSWPHRKWSPGPIEDQTDPNIGVHPDALRLIGAAGKSSGFWIVSRLDEKGKLHYHMIARAQDGQLATHGGNYDPKRVVFFAKKHLRRYRDFLRTRGGPEAAESFRIKLLEPEPPLLRAFGQEADVDVEDE